MARNTRRSNGMKKIEPAVQTMFFNTPATQSGVNQSQTSFIDLSQCASLLNRRFYRQGINWAVSRIQIFSSTAGSVVVSKLPNTWTMSNSWEKGFRTWEKMNDEAFEETESVRPKFLDFKIYADNEHHDAGFGDNLLPKSITDATTFTQAVPGEWESSKFVIPDTTQGASGGVNEFEVIAVGANYPGASTATTLDAVSLIEGYAASRGLPNVLDPNAPDDAHETDGPTPANWLTAIFNDGTQQSEEILETMAGPLAENNIAPYPFENDGVSVDTMYPGGANQLTGLELHDFGQITGTTIGGQTTLKGGMFPCGLIRIDHTTSSTAANLAVIIDLVPGPHRGYMCAPMTDM